MMNSLSDIFNHNINKIFLLIRYFRKRLPISPFSVLKHLEKSQFDDRAVIEENQLHKINHLVRIAKERIPYYKSTIKGPVVEYKSLDEFNRSFNVLTKSDLIKNGQLFINSKKGKNFLHTTSGSTGQPLRVNISGFAESYRFAAKMRFHNWWGVHFFDRSVLVWKVKTKSNNSYSLIDYLKDKLKNRLEIDVFNLNDETIQRYVEQINNFDAKFIRGYKSGLVELARLMDKHDLSIDQGTIKVVIVTSEILLDSERNHMQKIFKCPVANEYGSAESGFYAAECENGSMHINEELVYIQTDKDNHAYVTELHNDRMPLINYKNEDQLIISENYCSCGRTSRIIEEIIGRTSDFVECQDGTLKSTMIFPWIIKDVINGSNKGSIEQYKFVQIGEAFILELVKGKNYNEEMSKSLVNHFHAEIGDDVKFSIKFVEKIDREPSGKMLFFKKIKK